MLSLIADTLLASELDKEEPPCGRHASSRDKTLASELSLDSLYEISFRSFVVFKKIVLHYNNKWRVKNNCGFCFYLGLGT